MKEEDLKMVKKQVIRPFKFLIRMIMVMVLMTSVSSVVFATDAEIVSLQLGDSYNSIVYAYGGDRHHCPAKDGYVNTTVYRYNSNGVVNGTVTAGTGPCVLITITDHQKTASWGSSTAAINYRAQQLNLLKQGKYGAAQTMDINDLKAKVGGKYNTAISRMVSYTNNTLNWNKK
jgi:hypothetical protein